MYMSMQYHLQFYQHFVITLRSNPVFVFDIKYNKTLSILQNQNKLSFFFLHDVIFYIKLY